MMYRGALDAFARISREEGLGAFYKGEQGNGFGGRHTAPQPTTAANAFSCDG